MPILLQFFWLLVRRKADSFHQNLINTRYLSLKKKCFAELTSIYCALRCWICFYSVYHFLVSIEKMWGSHFRNSAPLLRVVLVNFGVKSSGANLQIKQKLRFPLGTTLPYLVFCPDWEKGRQYLFSGAHYWAPAFFSYFTYKTCNLRLFRAPYIFLFASSGTFKMTQYNSYKYENIKLTLSKPPYLWIIKQNLA